MHGILYDSNLSITSVSYVLQANYSCLWQVEFTGNYNEYFGYSTDVDAVVYLMLVNDMIHGLYPEAIVVGEDVSVMHLRLVLKLNYHLSCLLSIWFRYRLAGCQLFAFLSKTVVWVLTTVCTWLWLINGLSFSSMSS